MEELSSMQRKHLRGLAHHLRPVVQLGREGASASAVRSVEDALDAHELIKVKFVARKDEKAELAGELAERTGACLAGLIGNVAILYRRHSDPERRRIAVPSGAAAETDASAEG